MVRLQLLAAVLGVGALTAPATANLISNGSFEKAPVGVDFRSTAAAPSGEVQDYFGNRLVSSQYLADWTIEAPGVSDLIRAPYLYALGPQGPAPDGSQFMSINWSPAGGITLDNTITQAFTLGAGATGIDFSTWMAVESGYAASTLTVLITDRGGNLVAQSDAFTHQGGNGTWSKKTWSTSLGAGDYLLKLHGIGAGNAWDVLVDDVQLNALGLSAAPEPATWAMLVGGFGLVGVALRQGRRNHGAASQAAAS